MAATDKMLYLNTFATISGRIFNLVNLDNYQLVAASQTLNFEENVVDIVDTNYGGAWFSYQEPYGSPEYGDTISESYTTLSFYKNTVSNIAWDIAN